MLREVDRPAVQELALTALIEAGEMAPVIHCTGSLRDVPEAIRYLEEGHARGKTVVTV